MRSARLAGLLLLTAFPVVAEEVPGEIPCESAWLRMPRLETVEAALQAGGREICIENQYSRRVRDSARFIKSTEFGSYVLSDTVNAAVSLWTTHRTDEGFIFSSIPDVIADDDWFQGGKQLGNVFQVDSYDVGWVYVPSLDVTCLIAEGATGPVPGTPGGYRELTELKYCLAGTEQLSQHEAEAVVRATTDALAERRP